MAFEIKHLKHAGPGLYRYDSDDAPATVSAANYFVDAVELLRVGDVIDCLHVTFESDGRTIATVISIYRLFVTAVTNRGSGGTIATISVTEDGIAGTSGDVRLYGAIGDGVTNDSAAIQDAIDGSDVVYLPDGQYLSDQLSPDDATDLLGDGSHISKIVRRSTGNLIDAADQDDVRVTGVRLDMQFGTLGSGHGIAISGGARHIVRDVAVEDFGDAGSGAGTGILIFEGAAKPRVARIDACDIEANTAATVSVGWIFADVDTSFASHIYVKNVQDGIGYAHELKNDARHNYLGGLIAESCNVALAYGQDTVGVDGADYNLAQGIVGKACDIGFLAGEAVGNVVIGLLHDAASSPGNSTKRTVDLQSSSTQNVILGAAAHGNVAGPVRIDGDENYVEIADFSSAAETVRFQSGAQRNGVHVVHPGTRTTIRSRIVDSSGSGISGTDCNVVISPMTGEHIGSLSGRFLWALGTPTVSYSSTHYWRFESPDHAVLSFGTPGNIGDTVGINFAAGASTQQAQISYTKNTVPTNEYWKVRVNDADVLRIFGTSLRPETDDAYDLGTQSVRFQDAYIKQLQIGPASAQTTWTSGAGTPEGAVSAVVGSLYTRTDGGAGTTLYVKESGSGNTGWVAK